MEHTLKGNSMSMTETAIENCLGKLSHEQLSEVLVTVAMAGGIKSEWNYAQVSLFIFIGGNQ